MIEYVLACYSKDGKTLMFTHHSVNKETLEKEAKELRENDFQVWITEEVEKKQSKKCAFKNCGKIAVESSCFCTEHLARVSKTVNNFIDKKMERVQGR